MAISDNFNAYTDGNTLDSESADWTVWNASGGVMTLDEHDDHSNGSLVVDMSGAGVDWAIHQTQVGGNDHSVEVDAFLDGLVESGNQVGVLLRGSASSMGSSAWDGYMVSADEAGAGVARDIRVRIYRIDDDSATQLAESANIHGSVSFGNDATPGTDAYDTLTGEIDGSAIGGFANAGSVVSTTDSTYTTGQFVGVMQNRANGASGESQPFFDNFAADTIGVADVPNLFVTRSNLRLA